MKAFYVVVNGVKTLATFSDASSFLPMPHPVLREDDVVYDGRHPKSAGHLASWKGATFGMVRNGGTRPHQGWDFFAMKGTPCFAVGPGQVATSYVSEDYGSVLVLKLPGNHLRRTVYAAYAHLQEVLVKPGQAVHGGEPVALSGLSGNAGSYPRYPHLHFELREVPRPGFGLEGRLDPATMFGDPRSYRPAFARGDSFPGPFARALPGR